VLRIGAWLGIVALALASAWLNNPLLRALCLPALLLALATGIRMLRTALLLLAAVALIPIALGYGDAALDLAPTLVAALIGWIFARTLLPGRQPLIARMIAAIDGAHMLDDIGIRRYARRLTLIWAFYQVLLALAGLVLAVHVWSCPDCTRWLPGPHLFGVVLLPAAVGALMVGEFLLRRQLLPQAPHRSLVAFLGSVARAWPAALED
jgi:uncharacterized membrane protein